MRDHLGRRDFKGTTGRVVGWGDDMGSQEDYEEDSDGPCQVHERPRGAMS